MKYHIEFTSSLCILNDLLSLPTCLLRWKTNMDAKQTTMSTRLNFLLTHFLSSTTDAELSGNVNYVIADLKQGGNRVFREADAAALSRWSTKVGSLVASPQSRTSGFRLAKISLELSPALWTTAAGLGSAATNSASAKAWFDQAFRLVQVIFNAMLFLSVKRLILTCAPSTFLEIRVS